MTRTVPEADAVLLAAEDIHRDVQPLTASLQRRQAEQHAYAVLSRPEVSELLKTLIANGTRATEEEAVQRGLEMLLSTVSRYGVAGMNDLATAQGNLPEAQRLFGESHRIALRLAESGLASGRDERFEQLIDGLPR